MPCLLLIAVVGFPRLAMLLLFLFTTYLQHAYHNILMPALGFVFLPLTTLAYAWMVNSHQPIVGLNALILVAAVVVDAGGLGGGAWHRSRRDY
jgi:phosphoglycerol transferase MdoB-like AlkP superfamily enzyme